MVIPLESIIEHKIPRDHRKTIGMDAAAHSGATVMNAPLGDEDLATKVTVIGCETYKLEEPYKILMVAGVDLRSHHLVHYKKRKRSQL